VEDGYTRIANELLEAILKQHFTQSEMSVLLAVIRKTYGYNKKEDDISASQIGKLIGTARENVTRTLNGLAAKNVINKRLGVSGSVIGIQKDYSQWGVKPAPEKKPSGAVLPFASVDSTQGVSNPTDASVKTPHLDSVEPTHTKDNVTKDNIQKKTRAAIALRAYLENCKKDGIKPIPEDDPVFKYASDTGIPDDFLRLQWLEFRDRFQAEGAKRYKSWPQAFRNSVRANWYKLWYATADGSYALTTAGQQAARLHGRNA
jgi:phage replication O-like protein O